MNSVLWDLALYWLIPSVRELAGSSEERWEDWANFIRLKRLDSKDWHLTAFTPWLNNAFLSSSGICRTV